MFVRLIGCLIAISSLARLAKLSLNSMTPEPIGLTPTPAIWDVGLQEQGAKVKAAFRLKNNYAEAVTIHQIQASCSCMASEVSKKILAPGESTDLSAEWTMNGMGTVQTEIAVVHRVGESPSPSTALLQLQGKMISEIEMEPLRIEFRRGAPAEAAIRFRPGVFPQAAVLKATVQSSCFDVSLDADAKRLIVRYRPDQPHNEVLSDQVQIETNCPKQRFIAIPLDIRSNPGD